MALKPFTPNVSTQEAVIASGQSLSAAVDLQGSGVVAIQMPAAWDAAPLTFQASHDGSTYANVYDAENNEYAAAVDASRFIVMPTDNFIGARYLKVRSGTASSAVNQSAERTIVLIVKPTS